MFDNAPLELEDLIDQCRALAYALVELDHPEAKDILTFVLSEHLDFLYRTFHLTPEEGNYH
ncbi:hypothetical protein [Symbiopectobacterium purcellii]|uniref:Uncharacterized protein n=1 Tax=Symbiopectobacterium purcellii TaxID=2871826 RepID=A0ABX9AH60_9ENTR|nr:hypothetical protein [Symbiopectobacterium purcellii]QZN94483.1 hypothetical protein K6K13_14300 [Symbiopectobacterium purcellii]